MSESEDAAAAAASLFTCELCGYSNDRKYNYERHLKSAGHLKRAANPEGTSYTCEACEFTTNNKSNWNAHQRTKKHLAAIRSATSTALPANPWELGHTITRLKKQIKEEEAMQYKEKEKQAKHTTLLQQLHTKLQTAQQQLRQCVEEEERTLSAMLSKKMTLKDVQQRCEMAYEDKKGDPEASHHTITTAQFRLSFINKKVKDSEQEIDDECPDDDL